MLAYPPSTVAIERGERERERESEWERVREVERGGRDGWSGGRDGIRERENCITDNWSAHISRVPFYHLAKSWVLNSLHGSYDAKLVSLYALPAAMMWSAPRLSDSHSVVSCSGDWPGLVSGVGSVPHRPYISIDELWVFSDGLQRGCQHVPDPVTCRRRYRCASYRHLRSRYVRTSAGCGTTALRPLTVFFFCEDSMCVSLCCNYVISDCHKYSTGYRCCSKCWMSQWGV